MSLRVKKRREKIFYLLILPSSISIGVFLLLLSVIIYNSIPAFEKLGISIYTTNIWNPNDDKYGGLAAIYGTIITGILSMLFSIPFSLSLAIFINDIAPARFKSILTNLSDLLASFPTVVYGFWGLFSLAPFLANTLFNFLNNYLGFLPFFSYKNTSGPSILLASIILTFMITPFASSLLREIYSQVPRYIEEAVYSLGLGKWELIRIKISYIRRAFLGAYALAFGRATGETVAVSLTIGNIFNLSPNLLAPGYTISSLIVSQFGTAYGLQYNAMFALALFLLVIGISFIILSRVIVR